MKLLAFIFEQPSYLCVQGTKTKRFKDEKNSDQSSLQCYSVLSDIFVKSELCIPLERGSMFYLGLSTGEGFICLSPPSCAFLFYLQKDNLVQLSDLHPMANNDLCHVTG